MERKEDGLIARSVSYLFESINKRTSNSDQEKIYTMRASYYEVYNEQVLKSFKSSLSFFL